MATTSQRQVEGGRSSNAFTAAIGGKGAVQYVRDVMRDWRTFVTTCVAVAGVVWTLIEASSYLLQEDMSGVRVLLVSVTVSFIAGAVHLAGRFMHAVPPGFEGELREAQRIAHFQRPLWEYRLARVLLRSKLAETDRRLAELMDGRSFT